LAGNFNICLDSEAANYDQLWNSTSIRGIVGGTLKISVLKNGVHSGWGSGMAPSVFTVMRALIDRIESSATGEFLLEEFKVELPKHRITQAQETADIIGEKFKKSIPFAGNTRPISQDVSELLLNRSWRPALSIVGINGVPEIVDAGNVTLPEIEFKLSVRTPPTCDVEKASLALKKVLEENPPFQAEVSFTIDETGPGWNAPELSDWLIKAINQTSESFFGKPTGNIGVGGSIPFMGMLGDMFPDAQFFITGVLGPGSNAHGPNEFLHLPYVKKLTGCVANIIAAHYENHS